MRTKSAPNPTRDPEGQTRASREIETATLAVEKNRYDGRVLGTSFPLMNLAVILAALIGDMATNRNKEADVPHIIYYRKRPARHTVCSIITNPAHGVPIPSPHSPPFSLFLSISPIFPLTIVTILPIRVSETLGTDGRGRLWRSGLLGLGYR